MTRLRNPPRCVLVGLLALAGVGTLLAAEPLAQAVAAAEKDLAAQRASLEELYRRLATEKQALATQAEALATRLQELRGQTAAALTRRQDDTAAQARTDTDLAHLRQMSRYVANLALEYRRSFEGRLSVAELAAAEADLTGVDRELGAAPEALSSQTLTTLLSASLERCQGALGGRRHSGQAVDAEGRILSGTYLTFGPLSFFQAQDGRAGLAVQPVGGVHPTLYADFDPQQQAALSALFETGRARVPVDVTMGSAIRVAATHETLIEHLCKGGIVMIPLLLLGLLCAVVATYKMVFSLSLATERCRLRTSEVIESVHAGDLARAEHLAGTLGRPLRSVIRVGLAHRTASRERLEEILFEQIVAEVPSLERLLSTLAVGASSAPLLGLLGTVTGMIHTFRLITVFGTGDARLLSSGISEALITTEVGLFIAIPALLCHAYLSRRIRHVVSMVQEVAVMFLNGVTARQEGPPG